MGDLTIAQDLIDGVQDVMSVVGDTRTLRMLVDSPRDPLNPGAAPTRTPTDFNLEAFLFDFDESYFQGANSVDGDMMAIIDINTLSGAERESVDVGNQIIDGSNTYEVTAVNKIEFAGVAVTYVLQLKG